MSLLVLAPLFRLGAYLWFGRTPPFQDYAYALTPSRADQLALGTLLGIAFSCEDGYNWMQKHLQQLYGLLTILTCVNLLQIWQLIHLESPEGEIVGQTTLALFFGCVVLLVTNHRAGKLAAIFRWKWFTKLGTISYCTYLIHNPINFLCHYFILHARPQFSNWGSIGTTFVALSLTLVLASLSWRYFERPLIDRGHRV